MNEIEKAFPGFKKLHESWYGFVEMRNHIKAPLSDFAIKLAIDRLIKFTNDGFNPKEVLDNSIMHNWRGLFVTKGMEIRLSLKREKERCEKEAEERRQRAITPEQIEKRKQIIAQCKEIVRNSKVPEKPKRKRYKYLSE